MEVLREMIKPKNKVAVQSNPKPIVEQPTPVQVNQREDFLKCLMNFEIGL